MSNSANPAPTRPGFWWIRHVNPLAGKWRPAMVDTIHGVLGFKMFSWQGWMAVSEAELAGMEWGPECVFPEAEKSRTSDAQPKGMPEQVPPAVECPTPWGFELWQHLHREHGLTLLESELSEIINKATAIGPRNAESIRPADVQWWVADLDRYGNPTLTDGAHSKREGCEAALYIMARLGLRPEQKRAICKVEIYPPEAKSHDTNEDALNTLNRIGLCPKKEGGSQG